MQDFTVREDEFLTSQERHEPSKAARKVLSYVPTVLMSIAIASASALSTLIQFRFDVQAADLGEFVTFLTLRLILVFAAKYLFADLRYRNALESKDLLDAKAAFLDLAGQTRTEPFRVWVEAENDRRKRAAYLAKISRKLYRIDRAAGWLRYKNECKPKRRYRACLAKLAQKRAELERVSTPEFVDANIAHIRVRYSAMSYTDFLTPSEISGTQIERYSINATLEIGKGIAKGLPVTMVLVIMGTFISSSIIVGSINVVSAIFDLMTVGINAVMGWHTVGRKVSAALLAVYINRTAVLHSFAEQSKTE